jgi:hypothetical protein
MLEDTMNDMDNDSSVLSGRQVSELATMQPLLVYEQAEDKKVKVAILNAVRSPNLPETHPGPDRFSIRIQGIRKGELTYNANRTINELSLVPVLALIDAELVDRMRVSPEALALGKAAIDSLNPAPSINPLVDLLVTEYEESAPVEREFFLPSDDELDDYNDTLPIPGDKGTERPTVQEVMESLDPDLYCGNDTMLGYDLDPNFAKPISYGDPTTSPNFTGSITFNAVQEQPTMNTQDLGTVEQVIPEPALIEDGEGTLRVSDNLDATAYQSPEALSVHPDRSPNNDRVDAAVEPMAVPGQGAEAYTVDPMGLPLIETTPAYGVQEDGTLVPFDEAVHELPIDQLPM